MPKKPGLQIICLNPELETYPLPYGGSIHTFVVAAIFRPKGVLHESQLHLPVSVEHSGDTCIRREADVKC